MRGFSKAAVGVKLVNRQEIKVLVTDIDGTIMAEDRENISRDLQKFLKEWIDRGKLWVVASGRPEQSLRDCFLFWDTRPTAFIAENRYIFYQAQAKPGPGMKFVPDSNWNHDIKVAEHYLDKEKPEKFEELARWATGRYVVEAVTDDWIEFYSEDEAMSAETHLDSLAGEGAQTVRNGCYLSLMPESAGKGPALQRLIEAHLEVKPGQVLCVGDSGNDLDMLNASFGFHSVASRTAEPGIKKAVRKNDGFVFEDNFIAHLSHMFFAVS